MSLAQSKQAAIVELLVGAAIIGSNGLMVRLTGMPPTAVAFWRMLLAAVLLAGLVQWRHGWQPLSRKTWLWLLGPVIAFAVDLWLWHKSIPVSYTHLDVYKRQVHVHLDHHAVRVRG